MTPGCSTICLPIGQDDYRDLIGSPTKFRCWIDGAFRKAPELFPRAFARGYTLKDQRHSAKLGLPLDQRTIADVLKTAGYRPQSQWYQASGTKCRNVEVEIRGASRPGEIVIVGAQGLKPKEIKDAVTYFTDTVRAIEAARESDEWPAAKVGEISEQMVCAICDLRWDCPTPNGGKGVSL